MMRELKMKNAGWKCPAFFLFLLLTQCGSRTTSPSLSVAGKYAVDHVKSTFPLQNNS